MIWACGYPETPDEIVTPAANTKVIIAMLRQPARTMQVHGLKLAKKLLRAGLREMFSARPLQAALVAMCGAFRPPAYSRSTPLMSSVYICNALVHVSIVSYASRELLQETMRAESCVQQQVEQAMQQQHHRQPRHETATVLALELAAQVGAPPSPQRALPPPLDAGRRRRQTVRSGSTPPSQSTSAACSCY